MAVNVRQFLLLFLLSACTASSSVPYPAGASADWPAYAAKLGGTRFSPAVQITPANVAQLELAWEHRSGDVREAQLRRPEGPLAQSSFQVTPIVVDDRMYYCTPFNRVFALDADTGEELWVYDPKVNMDEESLLTNCRGVSSWKSGVQGFCEHRIFLGTLDARLIALDASTGKPCDGFGHNGSVDTSNGMAQHHPREYGISSPPAILANSVITGGLVLDNQRVDVPAGVVRSYDAYTGKVRWAWNPTQPGRSQRGNGGEWRSGTTNVWSIISVDEARDLVFLPTGNTSPDYFGGHRKGSDFYSSSVVALRGSTGEVVWHQQLVHHDVWDYDTPAQPALIDLHIDGAQVPAVVQVTKMGISFAFHRETGEPLWPITETPVPQTGGVAQEYFAPTQPFTHHIKPLLPTQFTADDAWGLTPWDASRCRKRINSLENQGFYTPPSTKGSIHLPSNTGGNNWGSPAIDPNKRVMVVYTSRVPGVLTLVPRARCKDATQPQTGTPYCVETGFLTSPLGMPCSKPPWGTLDAVDLDSGDLLWSVPLGTTRDIAPFPMWWIKGLPGFGGPIITASGLVFSGISNEHALRAFDAGSGKMLWHQRLPTAANAVPMTYQTNAGGKQFIVIAAGGHWSGGSPAGDHILAFALPKAGKASTQP